MIGGGAASASSVPAWFGSACLRGQALKHWCARAAVAWLRDGHVSGPVGNSVDSILYSLSQPCWFYLVCQNTICFVMLATTRLVV